MNNYIEIKLPAYSINEAFARNAIASFCVTLNPTIDEIDDIKTIVSEAVTNCIVHAYKHGDGNIILRARLSDDAVHIEVEDFGMGISDLTNAVKPFVTDKAEDERSGMGFTIMRSFSDNFDVKNKADGGVIVKMCKRFGKKDVEAVTSVG